MKFLADENIALAVVEHLRTLGHDVVSITELSPGVSDANVLLKALEERRILVTSDTDFGELVYHVGQKHTGIILLRLYDQRNANKIRVLKKFLKQHTSDLPEAFVVVTEKSVRIRITS
ncbi:DUF5615 family PIN-like protein [Candidatus Gottesmanbacteria bacterium]|nr:DUF5615 family PIN-like protein [Candidatus Gottesmanbacteria bacterium]